MRNSKIWKGSLTKYESFAVWFMGITGYGCIWVVWGRTGGVSGGEYIKSSLDGMEHLGLGLSLGPDLWWYSFA